MDQDYEDHVHVLAPDFRLIAQQKMHVMSDAWDAADWVAVVYVDSDIIFMRRFIEDLVERQEEIFVTPNYYPGPSKYRDRQNGYYNGGFILCRTRNFHSYWLDRFSSNSSPWADQVSLDDLPLHFTTRELEDTANIGFWRSSDFPRWSRITITVPSAVNQGAAVL